MIVFAAAASWFLALIAPAVASNALIWMALIGLPLVVGIWHFGWRKSISTVILVLMPLASLLWHSPSPELRAAVSNFASAQVRFEVLQDSSSYSLPFGSETRVKVALLSLEVSGSLSKVRGSGWLSCKETRRFTAGEKYESRVQFSPPRNRGADFSGSIQGKPHLIQSTSPFQRWIGDLKSSYLKETVGINPDSKALVTGMAIGDVTGLSDQAKNQMVTVSLTHLVAVSGANCAIVVAAVFVLMGKLIRRRWSRFFATEVVLVGYVYLTNSPPSVIRAAVMASCVVLAKTLGRRVSALSALALAVLACLFLWPELSGDLGFALSVVATLGLLVVAPALVQRLPERWPLWLRASVAVSASAQLLCTPILLQLQNGLPLYSVPANILAEPLVAPVTIIGLIALMLVPLAPALASILVYLASLATNFIITEAAWFAQLPEATLPWLTGWPGIGAAIALVLAAIFWAKMSDSAGRKLLATIFLLVGIFELAGAGVGYIIFARWPTNNWFVASCDVGQGDATLIRSEDQVALIDVGRDPVLISKCLNRLKIHRLDLLVLTHFDFDHVGGLSGVLATAKVSNALVTSFVDSRPGAEISRDLLRSRGVDPILSGVGLFGKLGRYSWRVISPHQGAAEAEDSNDGSVTMLFDSPEDSIVTLADLGEKGQMRLAREIATWLPTDFYSKPRILKVSHHGSADQYPEFIESLKPDVALISVGAKNGYGHPTRSALAMLRRARATVLRTDLMGSIAIGLNAEGELVKSISGPTASANAR